MANWQTKKLSDLMSFIPTGSHSRDDMTRATSSNQVYNIHYGDIHTKYSTYVDLEKDDVPVLRQDDSRPAMLLQDGDLVVADASEDYEGVGSAIELRNVNGRKVIGGLHTFALHSTSGELAPGFAGILLKNPSIHNRLMQMSVYSKVYGLTKSSISSVYVCVPEKAEQERIVGVLETWDEYIEKLERKIELKEQLKKGLMQQLLTGKRRLPGFNKEWRKITLGEIGRISMCKRIFNEQTSEHGDVPFFKIGTFGKRPDAFISQELYDSYRHKYSFPNVGDILVSASGTIGRTVVYDGAPAYFQDSNIIWIANDETKVLNRFLYYLYTYVKWDTASGTIARLYNDNVRRVKISQPTLEEQSKIADILQTYDQDIIVMKRKLSILQAQKKYLLKNLITGNIRTPENLTPYKEQL